ncbi:DUF4251 domain-containing protein [Psychroserpens damuponensis]|uniref:DUF4251 domain-containing protein n=1 Tax=Psychroserpens damuponensis TaxID=943936 RepID=UPI000693E3E1|nr:DUF4251 domain-containing protein [Psychroserpens damuponensis]
MIFRGFVFVFFLGLFFNCGSAKPTATPEQIARLDQLVKNQSFVIESNWALPQTTNTLMALQNAGFFSTGDSASRISLSGNPNELKIDNQTVTSQLPYFGEVQSTSGYNGSDNSISFEGDWTDYRVVKNDNSSYTIRFDAKSHSENFDVIIHLYPNLSSEIILKGAKRFPIRYTGFVSSISEEN